MGLPFMKRTKKAITYETRYKRKLNMLEPGTAMLKWIVSLALVAIALHLLHFEFASYIVSGVAGTIFLLLLLLLLLLAIEARQDRVLNEIAAQEHKDR